MTRRSGVHRGLVATLLFWLGVLATPAQAVPLCDTGGDERLCLEDIAVHPEDGVRARLTWARGDGAWRTVPEARGLQVLIGGARQTGVKVKAFSRARLPLSMVVVVSLYNPRDQKVLDEIKDSLRRLAKSLAALQQDAGPDAIELTLFGFGDRLVRVRDPGPIDLTALTLAIENIRIQADAPEPFLLGAVHAGLDALGRKPGRRKILVVIADGNNNGGNSDLERALKRAERQGVVIDTLALKDVLSGNNTAQNRLVRLATESGGLARTCGDPSTMKDCFANLIEEVDSQWVVDVPAVVESRGPHRLTFQTPAPGPAVTATVELPSPKLLSSSTAAVAAAPPTSTPTPPSTVDPETLAAVGAVLFAILSVLLFVVFARRRRDAPPSASPWSPQDVPDPHAQRPQSDAMPIDGVLAWLVPLTGPAAYHTFAVLEKLEVGPGCAVPAEFRAAVVRRREGKHTRFEVLGEQPLSVQGKMERQAPMNDNLEFQVGAARFKFKEVNLNAY